MQLVCNTFTNSSIWVLVMKHHKDSSFSSFIFLSMHTKKKLNVQSYGEKSHGQKNSFIPISSVQTAMKQTLILQVVFPSQALSKTQLALTCSPAKLYYLLQKSDSGLRQYNWTEGESWLNSWLPNNILAWPWLDFSVPQYPISKIRIICSLSALSV